MNQEIAAQPQTPSSLLPFQKSRAAKGLAILAGLVGATFCSASALAAAITPGDLVIYRVGDGSAALSANATAVFLDEYTQAGALVQSIPLPSTGANALTAVGNSGTEGIISRSL